MFQIYNFHFQKLVIVSESLSSYGRIIIIITRDDKLHRPGNIKSELRGKHSGLESYL